MKPELAESILVEQLLYKSIRDKKIPKDEILKVNRLSGDASTRRYYRVNSKEGFSYVVCLDDPRKEDKNKYPFYVVQKFLEGISIRVPEIIDIDLKRGYILEEDLGDQTLLSYLAGITTKKAELAIFKQCTDILITLQAASIKNKKNLIFSKLKFDVEKYMYEFEFTLEQFIKKLLKINLSVKDKKILIDGCQAISSELASYPMVPTHRDFHSRNIMVKDGEFILIDFQDARMGIPQYDAVSILEDCYYQIRPENKQDVLKHYWENGKFPKQKSFDHFTRLYDLMTIQRVFKAVGSFSYIYHVRKDERYLRYIGRSMENVRSKLDKFPEFANMRKLIFKMYYES